MKHKDAMGLELYFEDRDGSRVIVGLREIYDEDECIEYYIDEKSVFEGWPEITPETTRDTFQENEWQRMSDELVYRGIDPQLVDAVFTAYWHKA